MGGGYREDGNLEKASLMLSGGVRTLMQGTLAQEAWATDQGADDSGGVGGWMGKSLAQVQADGPSAQEEGLSWNHPGSR